MRALLDDSVVSALLRFLEYRFEDTDTAKLFGAYSLFVSRLYGSGAPSLGEYIKTLAENDENIYIKTVGRGETPPSEIEKSMQNELFTLGAVSELTKDELLSGLENPDFLPDFPSRKIDIAEDYRLRAENIGKYGYGIYAQNTMFYIDGSGRIIPVMHPDSVRLCDLADYEREKKIILDNTRALLDGKPAANMLLTGDAGTGKSSTVKAVVNELKDDGLRILEIRKEQLREIPAVLDELSQNPLKFILFIDDLSFTKDDDNYSALKAVLEGSVSARSQNVAIYATSNRRHLVKESFSDRDGDDVHRNDTLQELISLSDRFGIQVTFSRPDKSTYLDIVHHLAAEHGIKIKPEELDLQAEAFALSRGGRSARAARQFVDGILAR